MESTWKCMELHGIHVESTMEMYGIHVEMHGIHMKMYGTHGRGVVWNPCGIQVTPW